MHTIYSISHNIKQNASVNSQEHLYPNLLIVCHNLQTMPSHGSSVVGCILAELSSPLAFSSLSFKTETCNQGRRTYAPTYVMICTFYHTQYFVPFDKCSHTTHPHTHCQSPIDYTHCQLPIDYRRNGRGCALHAAPPAERSSTRSILVSWLGGDGLLTAAELLSVSLELHVVFSNWHILSGGEEGVGSEVERYHWGGGRQ